MFSYRFSVRDDREPVSFMLLIIVILQTTETPGTAVREQLVPYDTTWHLNVVGGNVECMIQPSIEYKISVVAMVGVSSVIQDNSYVVFESDICLRLTVPTTNERLPDTNMIKQLRYDF